MPSTYNITGKTLQDLPVVVFHSCCWQQSLRRLHAQGPCQHACQQQCRHCKVRHQQPCSASASRWAASLNNTHTHLADAAWRCLLLPPVVPRSTYTAVARDFPLSARQVLENLKTRAAEVSKPTVDGPTDRQCTLAHLACVPQACMATCCVACGNEMSRTVQRDRASGLGVELPPSDATPHPTRMYVCLQRGVLPVQMLQLIHTQMVICQIISV